MQSNIHPGARRLGLLLHSRETKKGIKGGGWVRVQERLPQSRLAHLVYRKIIHFVLRITETRFPAPRLEIITKFAHLTLKSAVEEQILLNRSRISVTLFQAAIFNPGRHRDSGKSCARRQGVVRHRERVKRILDWYTDADWTKAGP